MSTQYENKHYAEGDVFHASDVNNIIKGLNSAMRNELTQVKSLHIGNIVTGSYTASELNSSPLNRIVQHDSYAIPTDYEATFTFHSADENIWMGVRHGAKTNNLSSHIYWVKNGDTFTFPLTSKYYRCAWGHASALDTNGNPDQVTDTSDVLSPEIVNQMIQEGTFGITYVSRDITNIIERNFEAENYIKALMIDRERTFATKSMRDNIDTYPVICHTSDTHGDYERVKNFFQYSKYLNADLNFITGDVMGYTPSNGNYYIDNLDEEYGNGGTCITLGNHDTYYLSMTQQYENSIAPLEERNSYVCEQTPYYYKDVEEHSLRIIAISPYDYTDSAYHGTKCVLSQAQIDWFVATLASTPAGYGVCVLMHPPMTAYADVTMQNKYWQHYSGVEMEACPVWEAHTGISGQPIIDIVDAFISRSAISDQTFTNAEDSSTVTINADFTAVDSTCEFIAYFNGHTHCDVVGYYATAVNPQVVFNVCCGVATYGTSTYPYWANVCDVPRGLTGKSQDAFNVYVIDRANHVIRCGRVGSNTIVNGMKRDFMTIDYKNIVTED